MTDNLRIWSALETTNPKHTKPFQRAGGFKGTAIKPIYLTRLMTDQFGPCGVGWGMTKPEFQTIQCDKELLVFCSIAIWYVEQGRRSELVYGEGGDKVTIASSSGTRNSDEAFKAAYTDALSNAMKHIGAAADVHMGMFDDSKYVKETQKHFEEDGAPDPKKDPPTPKPEIKTDQKKDTDPKTNGATKVRLAGFFDRPSYEISWPDKPNASIPEKCAEWSWHATLVFDNFANHDEWLKFSTDNAAQFTMLKQGDKKIWEGVVKHFNESGKRLDPDRNPLAGG
jgi:hypothetical protein